MLRHLRYITYIVSAIGILVPIAYLLGYTNFNIVLYTFLIVAGLTLLWIAYMSYRSTRIMLYFSPPQTSDHLLKILLLLFFIAVTLLWVGGAPWPDDKTFITIAGAVWSILLANFGASVKGSEELPKIEGFSVTTLGGRPQTLVVELEGKQGSAVVFAQEHLYGKIREYPVDMDQNVIAIEDLPANKTYWVWAEDEEGNASWPVPVFILRTGGTIIPPPGCGPVTPPPAEKRIKLTLGKATLRFRVYDHSLTPLDGVVLVLENVRTGETITTEPTKGGETAVEVPLGRYYISALMNGILYDLGRGVRVRKPVTYSPLIIYM